MGIGATPRAIDSGLLTDVDREHPDRNREGRAGDERARAATAEARAPRRWWRI